jgi:predicted GIY-YIG superfamily endonuclease
VQATQAPAGKPAEHQASLRSSQIAMHYVYLLRSQSDAKQQYIGCTSNLKLRVAQHNRGDSPHTSKFIPWHLIAYFAFPERKTAVAFELYLKSGSGRAFTKRHFY